MTTPKINTIKRSGSRFYVHPDTGDKVPGVTSILSMLPKDFLKYWAAREVAKTAVDDLGAVVSIAMRDPAAAVDYLKRAPDRDVYQAADAGSDVHDLFERMARGEEIDPKRLPPDLKPYREHFAEFLDEFQPEFLFLEETVWSDTYGYAGSFDVIAKIDGEIAIGDWKTTRSGVHEEVALQMSAYRHADFILTADGEHLDLPEIEASFVLLARPEGWTLTPVASDKVLLPGDEEVDLFSYFLNLREIFRWEKEAKRSVIGKPINANAPKGKARWS